MNTTRFPDTLSLEGKVAVVTGGGRGIGRAVCVSLARHGACVIPAARDESALRGVVEQIKGEGGEATSAKLDVTSPEDVERLFSEMLPRYGGLDIFVNNAGITALHRLLETTDEELGRIIDTNLKGAIRCLKASAHLMKSQGRGGSIVVVTSINALWPLPTQAVYSATKSALEALVRCLASDMAREHIRVNSIAPGAIRTEMNRHLTDADIERLNHRIPLSRIGEPEDLGEAVSFLCSSAASYITGSTLVIDGGYMLRS